MDEKHLERFSQIENEKNTLLLANDDIPFPLTTEDYTRFFNSISGKKKNLFLVFSKKNPMNSLDLVVYFQ